LPKFYLGLGSNIQPEKNLAEAIERLRAQGDIQATSSLWESRAVGSAGPNFLNICVCFVAQVGASQLKKQVVEPIELALGRVRSQDRNAPRTIDIDILIENDRPLSLERWGYAFVLLPMAELLPDFVDPVTRRPLSESAARARAATWIIRRPEALSREPDTKTSG
jgi:2-amino-4-hydroxy-6-hydroxymethyldihydropteridine diphosphokinase